MPPNASIGSAGPFEDTGSNGWFGASVAKSSAVKENTLKPAVSRDSRAARKYSGDWARRSGEPGVPRQRPFRRGSPGRREFSGGRVDGRAGRHGG